MDFKEKKILVTGAGKGIGRCLAKKLSEAGAEVFAISRTAQDLDSLRDECPSIKTFCQDISQWYDLRKLAESLPPMHGLVNNAAVNVIQDVLEVSETNIDKIFSVNFKPLINLTQVVAGKMIEAGNGGSIVNVSSQASLVAIQGHLAYAASKAAVDQATKVMALEFGPHKIRVNAINPTVVMTDIGKLYWTGERVEPMLRKIPLGRFAEPEDVANTIMYLLSDQSAMITGTVLPIDGGYTAQ